MELRVNYILIHDAWSEKCQAMVLRVFKMRSLLMIFESAKSNVTSNNFEFRTFLRVGQSDPLISLNTEIVTLYVEYESYKTFVARGVEGLVKCAYYTLPRYQFV